MKSRLWITTLITTATLMMSSCAVDDGSTLTNTHGPFPLQDQTGADETIVLTSSDFEHGASIDVRHAFNNFGCIGDNAPPNLSWSNAPDNTKSFALIVHDPDAPTGVGFFHWVMINIPASTTTLSGTLPEGARELLTDYGTPTYGGPCPPQGRTHRYVFSIYALDVPQLELPENATGALTRFMLLQHTLAVGRLAGTFSR